MCNTGLAAARHPITKRTFGGFSHLTWQSSGGYMRAEVTAGICIRPCHVFSSPIEFAVSFLDVPID